MHSTVLHFFIIILYRTYKIRLKFTLRHSIWYALIIHPNIYSFFIKSSFLINFHMRIDVTSINLHHYPRYRLQSQSHHLLLEVISHTELLRIPVSSLRNSPISKIARWKVPPDQGWKCCSLIVICLSGQWWSWCRSILGPLRWVCGCWNPKLPLHSRWSMIFEVQKCLFLIYFLYFNHLARFIEIKAIDSDSNALLDVLTISLPFIFWLKQIIILAFILP